MDAGSMPRMGTIGRPNKGRIIARRGYELIALVIRIPWIIIPRTRIPRVIKLRTRIPWIRVHRARIPWMIISRIRIL